MNRNDAIATPAAPRTAGTALWIALIAGLTVVGSYGWACAAPLAAVAALAALTLGRTEGLVLVVATWIVNQAVGFVLLSYPHTFESYAWGAAIGAGAVAGYLAARAVVHAAGVPALVALGTAFAAAFVFYQLGMYALGNALANDPGAFSTAIVTEVFVINAIAFIGFVLIHRAAVALSLLKPIRHAAPAAA